MPDDVATILVVLRVEDWGDVPDASFAAGAGCRPDTSIRRGGLDIPAAWAVVIGADGAEVTGATVLEGCSLPIPGSGTKPNTRHPLTIVALTFRTMIIRAT